MRGEDNAILGRTLLDRPPEYQADVHLVRERGIRSFVAAYPDLVPDLRSHANTHPPGALVMLALLESWFPADLIARAVLLALLGAMVVIPTYVLAREHVDAGHAAYAPALLLACPALFVFLFTCLDAFFATVLVSLLAMGVVAIRTQTRGLSLALGVATALGTFFTYATSFVVVAIGLLAFRRLPASRAVRVLALAAAGGLIGLAILRATLGFDLFASYTAFRADFAPSAWQLSRSWAFWSVGNWGVWSMYAGIPLLSMTRMGLRGSGDLIAAVFLPVALFYLLPRSVTNLLPGETERTWLFLVPLLAVAGASGFGRLGLEKRSRTVVLGIAIVAGVAQGIVLRGLFINFY